MKKLVLIFILIIILITFKMSSFDLKVIEGDNLNYKYVIKYPNTKNLNIDNLNKYKNINDPNLKEVLIDYKIIELTNIKQIDYRITKKYAQNKIKTEYEIIYLKNDTVINIDEIIKDKTELTKKIISKIKSEYNTLVSDDFKYEIVFMADKVFIRSIYNIELSYYELIGIINDDYLNESDSKVKEYLLKKERYKDKKLVAITFDDGPSKYTDDLLDALKERDVQATFFLVGYNIKKYPHLIERMYLENHEIGNHTYHHYRLTKIDDDDVTSELTKVNELINKTINYNIKLVRPPYGSINSNIIKNNNYSYILWSLDTLDWKYRNADTVYNNIINNIEDGDIILLHDLYKTSVDGVIKAIDELKKQDYEFVTVSELALYKNAKLKYNTKYNSFKN